VSAGAASARVQAGARLQAGAVGMLAYKAWCETRSRLALGVATLGVASGLAIARGAAGAALGDSTKTLFVLFAIVLGTGGLRQERARGTLGLSLALPVPRGAQIAMRAAVAIVEVWALAMFVSVWQLAMTAVFAGAGATGIADATGLQIGAGLQLAVVWAMCGSLIACLAQLLASIVASDALVYLGTFLIVIGYEAVVQLTLLRDQPLCDLYRVMSGGAGMAWPALAGAVVLGAAMLAAASAAARRLSP
jgi:hypothetical protein